MLAPIIDVYYPTVKECEYEENPVITFSTVLKRIPGWYQNNHAIIIAFMTSLCFMSFFMDIPSLGDRLSVTLTLQLTIVA